MTLTVLGSGTSHGIPVIGCDCPVCRSSDSRDKRTRCSLYIKGQDGERAVIDTGPEFRIQALRAGIKRLDAVFLTHAHADHLHGLDDIRPFSKEGPIPIYGNTKTISEFRERFSYIFETTQRGGGKPQISTFNASGPITTGSLVFTPIPVKHGKLDILGWKISETGHGNSKIPHPVKSAVYITDASGLDTEAFRLIAEGGKPAVLIIGGLRVRPHETHFNFEEALYAAAKTGAPLVYLTHICHEHSHREIEKICSDFAGKQKLTAQMGPAWDGLEILLAEQE